jgi:hypothetical protein
MDVSELIATFPRLYHMAHADAWPGIQKHGLLSTAALLDLFEIREALRHQIESCRRPEFVALEHANHGRAVIRDNKPMDDAGLRRALTGATPEIWYKLLNQKVFFWVTEQRLTTLLNARAYKKSNHCVLTIDSAPLIRAYADKIWLCPMNSGCTKPVPHPRSLGTFSRIPVYPFEAWTKKRSGATKAVVELAVDYAIPDIGNFVLSAELRNGDKTIRRFK